MTSVLSRGSGSAPPREADVIRSAHCLNVVVRFGKISSYFVQVDGVSPTRTQGIAELAWFKDRREALNRFDLRILQHSRKITVTVREDEDS